MALFIFALCQLIEACWVCGCRILLYSLLSSSWLSPSDPYIYHLHLHYICIAYMYCESKITLLSQLQWPNQFTILSNPDHPTTTPYLPVSKCSAAVISTPHKIQSLYLFTFLWYHCINFARFPPSCRHRDSHMNLVVILFLPIFLHDK